MGYIYKIANTVNNKLYIGQTTNSLEERWHSHKCAESCYNAARHSKLYAAMKKYGRDKFYIEAIEKCADSDLDEREVFWISRLDTTRTGYNITMGGKGYKLVDDKREKKILSLWDSGLNEVGIRKETGHNFNLIKRVLNNNGVTSEMIRERQAEYFRHFPFPPRDGNPSVSKPVFVYDMDGNFIGEYASIKEASRQIGIDCTSISDVLKGIIPYAKNMVFRSEKTDRIEKTPVTRRIWKAEVHQYTLDGNYIASYPSYEAAAKAVGVYDGHGIKSCCQRDGIISGGYQWKSYKVDKIPSADVRNVRGEVKRKLNQSQGG